MTDIGVGGHEARALCLSLALGSTSCIAARQYPSLLNHLFGGACWWCVSTSCIDLSIFHAVRAQNSCANAVEYINFTPCPHIRKGPWKGGPTPNVPRNFTSEHRRHLKGARAQDQCVTRADHLVQVCRLHRDGQTVGSLSASPHVPGDTWAVMVCALRLGHGL